MGARTETATNSTDSTIRDTTVPAAAPIHRAIDRVTAVQLTVQRLRQQLTAQDGLAAELDGLESTLQELGALLVAMRDTKD